MSSYRSIAVGQTCPLKGDVNGNIREHVRLVRLAASEGARLIVFPELSLTGYELDQAAELAFGEEDRRLAALVEIAAANGVTIVAGAPVRTNAGLHIGAFVIDPGRCVSLYTKHRLGAFSDNAGRDGTVPPAETTVFVPGNHNPLIQVRDHTAAIAICADVGDPSHPEHAASRGATIYLASMFVIPAELDAEAERLRAYAVRHSLVVAFANFGGASGGLAAAGRSGIWSEQGESLVQLPVGGAGIGMVRDTGEGWVPKVSLVADLDAL